MNSQGIVCLTDVATENNKTSLKQCFKEVYLVERKAGLGPATPTLATLCSTN